MSKPIRPQVAADGATFGVSSASPCPKLTNAGFAREHMLISGAKVEDAVEVLWLQGATWFVDVRIGFNENPQQGWAFAGQIDWAEPRVTFHHLIDTAGETGSDCGSFVFTDFGCYEAGEVSREGVVLPFEEKWCRIADSSDTHAYIAETDNELVAVKVVQDQFTACVCSFGAAVYVEKDGVLAVDRAFAAPRPTQEPTAESISGMLEFFSSVNWRLVEATAVSA